jgi:hypothetical protein
VGIRRITMHSLKPSGDNIAQEFLRILGKKSLVKSAAFEVPDDPAEEGVEVGGYTSETGESVGGFSVEQSDFDFLAELEKTLNQTVDVGSVASGLEQSLEGMITDDDEAGGDRATEQLIAMDSALDSFAHTNSEKRVLIGLSKIAGSLRAKGEAFAADVVNATAISIHGDLQKEAGRKDAIVSGLKKLAREFYNGKDPLAGDMVQVTINKIGGNPFDELEDELDKQEESGGSPQDQLLQWSCVDDARGKKIRKDWKAKAEGGDQAVKMLMMQSKKKCPDMWT